MRFLSSEVSADHYSCIAVIFIFDFSVGCSSNSVPCIEGGFIVCGVLVANVSVQRCESLLCSCSMTDVSSREIGGLRLVGGHQLITRFEFIFVSFQFCCCTGGCKSAALYGHRQWQIHMAVS